MYSWIAALLTFFSPTIPDGTLLFVEGGSEIVMEYTNSPYSHVGIIFNENGVPYVYEAVRPRCRKIRLETYIKQNQRGVKLWIRKPKNLSVENCDKMKKYCEDELGRRYGISNYLNGKSSKRIHCSELVTRALIAGDMSTGRNPCNQAPKDVMEFSDKWYDKPSLAPSE